MAKVVITLRGGERIEPVQADAPEEAERAKRDLGRWAAEDTTIIRALGHEAGSGLLREIRGDDIADVVVGHFTKT